MDKTERSLTRITVHYLVKYTLPDGRVRISFCRNLSAIGMLLHSPEHIESGCVLPLKINVSGRQDAICVKGEVLRAVKLRAHFGFEVALKFTEIDENSKEFLTQMIARVTGKKT